MSRNSFDKSLNDVKNRFTLACLGAPQLVPSKKIILKKSYLYSRDLESNYRGCDYQVLESYSAEIYELWKSTFMRFPCQIHFIFAVLHPLLDILFNKLSLNNIFSDIKVFISRKCERSHINFI